VYDYYHPRRAVSVTYGDAPGSREEAEQLKSLIAAHMARDVRKETGHPARVADWTIYIDAANTCIAVTIAAYDGLRQRNCAI